MFDLLRFHHPGNPSSEQERLRGRERYRSDEALNNISVVVMAESTDLSH
jgi:hypothetical protein